ncbi:MAG: FAD-dependent monooxygenase [Beijerinckiaceae bacterium]
MTKVWDVAIAGGGATGLTLALALRVLSRETLRVILIDQSDPAQRSGPRTSALAEGPRRMLEKLSVWGRLEGSAQPIRRMEISDTRLADAVKASLLTFASNFEGEPLAHMLFHRDLEPQLLEASKQRGVEVLREAIVEVAIHGSKALLQTASGAPVAARLVVGADGLRSRMRAAARIPVVSWPYHRTALVMTVAHEESHDGIAIQHFLEGGPFASLPVQGRRSSIVWTEPTALGERYLRAGPGELAAALEARLGSRLGALDIEEGPQGFPLVFQLARRFVAPRLALIGDAAHRVHPLAGQGLNIGLRDVATLAELIVEQSRLGLDPGAEDVLNEYERRRRFDATTSAATFDFMHGGYALDTPAARAARRVGMSALERMDGLKRILNREASGLLGGTPELFR